LVALPIQIGNTPVTSGSNVPVCPTFLVRSSFRTLNTQSCEVRPAGLCKTKTPSTHSSSPFHLKKGVSEAKTTFETPFFVSTFTDLIRSLDGHRFLF